MHEDDADMPLKPKMRETLAPGALVLGQVPPSFIFVKVPETEVDGVKTGGETLKLRFEMAKMSPYIELIARTGAGREEPKPILLPHQVNSDVMELLISYMEYHSQPGRSDKEKRAFNEKYVRLDTKRLCELTSAADALKMRTVVDLASRQLARMIEGKSPDEIRAAFNLPDDLTEEEKLEPIRNVTEDARIRLLNRLYAKKRQELVARKGGGTVVAGVQPAAPSAVPERSDSRSVEELLSFIDGAAGGADGGSGGGGTAPSSISKKKKKKVRGGKAVAGSGSGVVLQDGGSWEWDLMGGAHLDQQQRTSSLGSGGVDLAQLLANKPVEELMDELFPEDGFEDSDKDQELVGEFQRRLTVDWRERSQELLRESSIVDPLALRLSSPRAGKVAGGGSSSGEGVTRAAHGTSGEGAQSGRSAAGCCRGSRSGGSDGATAADSRAPLRTLPAELMAASTAAAGVSTDTAEVATQGFRVAAEERASTSTSGEEHVGGLPDELAREGLAEAQLEDHGRRRSCSHDHGPPSQHILHVACSKHDGASTSQAPVAEAAGSDMAPDTPVAAASAPASASHGTCSGSACDDSASSADDSCGEAGGGGGGSGGGLGDGGSGSCRCEATPMAALSSLCGLDVAQLMAMAEKENLGGSCGLGATQPAVSAAHSDAVCRSSAGAAVTDALVLDQPTRGVPLSASLRGMSEAGSSEGYIGATSGTSRSLWKQRL